MGTLFPQPDSMDRDDRPVTRNPTGADTPPALSLLGDERYSIILTAAGSGVSRSGTIVVNRWRNDGTCDAHGQWCYLMNVGTGKVWSAGHQPVCEPAQSYESTPGGDCATIRRRDDDLETLTEIVALPDGSGEARRVSVTNHSGSDVELELTSYQEVVLASAVSDRGHRAFGNLFVQTEWIPESSAILAMRRPRSALDDAAWCGHAVAVGGHSANATSCETDRARFVGRGRSTRNPVAMDNAGNLSGTTGAVLDPILALRTALPAGAGMTATAVFTTFVAADREEALGHARLYTDFGVAERAIERALAAGDCVARDMTLQPGDTAAYHDLAGDLLYGVGRSPSGTRNALLAVGPTGEWPILLARLTADSDIDGSARLFALHEYLRRKGVASDMVIICNDAGLEREIRERAASSIGEASDNGALDEPKGIFIRNEVSLGADAIELLESLARVRIDNARDWRHR